MDTLTIVELAIVGLALAMIPAEIIYQSLYMLRANEKVVFYRFGQYMRTVLGRSYWDASWAGDQNVSNRAKVPDQDTVKLAFWKGSWAFGLWPFELGYRVPTDQFEVPIHASMMYTDSSNPKYPRVRVEGDATLQIRLSENPVHLGIVFSLFKQDLNYYLSKSARDLTNHEVLIQENGVEESVKRIAKQLFRVVNKRMKEAMREAATFFTFSVFPAAKTKVVKDTDIIRIREEEEGEEKVAKDTDIIRNRGEFERKVRKALTEDDDTIFIQGKLLRRIPGRTPDEDTVETGDSLLVCNIVVEKIQLQPASKDDAEASRAIDLSFIGHQEGLKLQAIERLRRIGEAEGIEALAAKLGLADDRQKAFLMDVIRSKAGEIKLSAINVKDAADVLSAIEGFLKKENS